MANSRSETEKMEHESRTSYAQKKNENKWCLSIDHRSKHEGVTVDQRWNNFSKTNESN